MDSGWGLIARPGPSGGDMAGHPGRDHKDRAEQLAELIQSRTEIVKELAAVRKTSATLKPGAALAMVG
jgi:hypothetical protein